MSASWHSIALTAADLRASVIAAPPLALTPDFAVAAKTNEALVRHIEAGGINLLLYGGNANIYHLTLAQYADALDVVIAASRTSRIIASIGPGLGQMLDQASFVERSSIRNVLLLPVSYPADTHGTGDGIRRIADRLGFGVILDISRDLYVRPVTLVKLLDEGAVSLVRYSVPRQNPADDYYLDRVIAIMGQDRVIGGLGEAAILDQIGTRQLASFTSGAAAIAPKAATRLLTLLRTGSIDAARPLLRPFHEFERVRTMLGRIQVLHDAVTAAGIADMGPQWPMISRVKPQFLDEVKAAVAALLEAEQAMA